MELEKGLRAQLFIVLIELVAIVDAMMAIELSMAMSILDFIKMKGVLLSLVTGGCPFYL